MKLKQVDFTKVLTDDQVYDHMMASYDKIGREFLGWYNYVWAIKDPDFRRSILNNFGWLLIVPTLSTFFGLVIANLADRIWWGTIAKSIIFMPMASLL